MKHPNGREHTEGWMASMAVALAAGTFGVLTLAGFNEQPAAEAQGKRGDADRNLTLTGVITRELPNGTFVVRARNGWTFRMRPLTATPPETDAGDHVRVYGRWVDGALRASNLRILQHDRLLPTNDPDSDDYLSHSKQTIVGEVVSNMNNNFVLRASNGWTYQVQGIAAMPDNMTLGDRVRAYGTWRDGQLRATNMRILWDGSVVSSRPEVDVAVGRYPAAGRPRTLEGTVMDSPDGPYFAIRTDAGALYRVSAPDALTRGVSFGDRVRVTGDVRDLVIEATRLRILNQARRMRPEQREALHVYTGTVTRDLPDDRFMVRSGNGGTYEVRSEVKQPDSLSEGDRVRIYGRWKDGMIHASNLRVLQESRS